MRNPCECIIYAGRRRKWKVETVFRLVDINACVDGNQSIQNELRFYQEIRESDAFTDCVENEKTGHGQGAQRMV